MNSRPPTHQRTVPDDWKPKQWIKELERRAQTAEALHPKVAVTFRRWAKELAEQERTGN